MDLFCGRRGILICHYRVHLIGMGGMEHIHLIGIGGTGLSAIAQVLLESGYRVSGSDRTLSPLAARIQAAGAQVFVGHDANNILGANVVVRSSAIPDSNPEVIAAQAAGIPVLKRSEFLGRITAGKWTIAIAGTHGKTTTTAMIAWMLNRLAQDPSYIIGGVAENLNTNAHAGQGPYFVIEADEYDHMFLGLNPEIAIITNIEHDHPDFYPTEADFFAAFRAFSRRVPPKGLLLYCVDDPGAVQLAHENNGTGRRAVGYGTQPAGQPYRAIDIKPVAGSGMQFTALCRDLVRRVQLQVPGEHNVRNALAALAVADELALSVEEAIQALGEFRGTGRRFEVHSAAAEITLVDDYAHHPTEIRSTLAAARASYPGQRIWAVWQPHTYSRTRLLQADFAEAFKSADRVLVTEIYPARELAPADGYSAAQVVSEITQPTAIFVPELTQAADYLLAELRPGDVVIVLSAGDADWITRRLMETIKPNYSEPSNHGTSQSSHRF